MNDITMCLNASCPLRETCYRFISSRDDFQSYASFEYKDGKCPDYIEAKSKSQVRRLNVQTARWSDKIRFTEKS